MHEFGSQLCRLLRRQGCPTAAVTRLMEEIVDHRACLEAEGIDQGLSPAEAASFAERELGSPATIAAEFIRLRRNRDWWGRHPFLLFGLGPPILFVCGFAAAFLLVGTVGAAQGWWRDPATLAPSMWMSLTLMVPLFHFLLLLVLSALACHLARSYCYGWKWALLACLILAFHAGFHFVQVDLPLPHASGLITWGYGFSNDLAHHLWKGLPPLLPFAWHLVRDWPPPFSARTNLSPTLDTLAL